MNNVKKSIGWADWTINPVKGLCPVGCPYCYARRAYGRNCNATFKDKTIRYEPSVFLQLCFAKPGDKIFVGSTIDLFHPLCSQWNERIFDICSRVPELTFIFLTKCPENLPREWPDNCWVGLSVDGTLNAPLHRIYNKFDNVKAIIKLLSFEPLLAQIKLDPRDLEWAGISWVIIGQQTPVKQSTTPKIEWIKEIVDAADKAKIPVFLKGNLSELLMDESRNTAFWRIEEDGNSGKLRQEIPEFKKTKEEK